jgi:selenide,water dikinase
MAFRLKGVTGQAEVTLLEREAVIAPDAPVIRPRLMRACAAAGVRIVTGVAVSEVTATGVALGDGQEIAAGFVAGAAGARAHGWLAGTGLPVTADGFLRVAADLRVEGQEALFAAGDCAHLTHAPRPKAGVYAVRAAPVLRDNLRAVLSGGRVRVFHPQRDYLKLISLGEKSALAEKMGMAFGGPLLWRLKDRIDRKFMAQFKEMPAMASAEGPPVRALGGMEPEPLCGGCGAKVAPGVLATVLAAEPPDTRPDVLTGPGDDAAVITVGGVRQVLTTDHLRGFTEDHGVMARIAALHALGDIWAMGAKPQVALVSVTLPRMSEALQARSMAEIMAQAGDALRAAGAGIVGGHSTVGAEASIGFTLTGLLERDPVTVAGARPGDALILTRPIGSGVLLAAEMRGQASGRDIAALLGILQVPQGDAAEILAGARAMTDVTGFGLAGHLMAICRASGVGAEVDLAAVPVYPGALALAEAGVRSTIWTANLAAAPVEGGTGAARDLLHDPQTAGGLLAAVDAADADAILAQLHKAGHQAARIGHVTAGSVAISCSR